MYATFKIPPTISSRLPRHWLAFVEDSINELQYVTSTVYDGQVSKGSKNGLGQLIFPNGDVYKGAWKADLRHGTGLCKFGSTGAIYKGEWRDGKPSGNGVLFTMPNEIIEARFDGYSVIDGQVKILFTNGEYYEGTFKNNLRNGTGNHYYHNKDYYEGEWANGRRIGRARIILAIGGKINGMFIEDKSDGYVEFEDKEGNMFQTENEEAKTVKRGSTKAAVAHHQPGSFTNGKLYK